MTDNLTQLLAATAAVIKLERLASYGLLPDHEEHDVRVLVERIHKAFSLPRISNVIELKAAAQ